MNPEINLDFRPVLLEEVINKNEAIEEEQQLEQRVFKKIPKKRYMEPAIFLIFIAYNLSSAIFTNEIVYQTCKVTLGYNESDCKLLGTEKVTEDIQRLEAIVQPYAAKLEMFKSMIESFFPAIVNLFFGNWSDKHGRKPIIINSILGYLFIYLFLTIISHISTIIVINPWYYMIAFIPILYSGGMCALITATLAFVCDSTTVHERAIKMGMLEAFLFCGLLLGSVSSSYIYNATNTKTIFGLSFIFVLIGLLYVIFFVDESVTILQNNELEKISKFKELFRFSLLSDMIKTCFKRRPNSDRIIIWLIMIVLGINISVMEGAEGIFFLYVRDKFQWTIRDFTLYEATTITVQIVGNIFAMFVLIKIFKIPEIFLAITALVSYLVDSIINGIAYYSFHLYLAVGVSLFKSIAGPMMRSVLTIVVPSSDIGKVFSLTTSIESFLPIFSSFLYTYVYNISLMFYPGAFNFISVIFYIISIVIMSIVYKLYKKRPVEILYENLN